MITFCLAIATLAAFVATSSGGRLCGLAVTSLSGAAMAFFVMPPRFSIEIADPSNLAILSGYCVFGVFLAIRMSQPKVTPIRAVVKRLQHDESGCALVDVLADVAVLGVVPAIGGVGTTDDCAATLPCGRAEAAVMLGDILQEANRCGANRILIVPTRMPGSRMLTIVARRIAPPDGEVITIGKRHDRCEKIESIGWPANAAASWFDNGFERIYQVAFRLDAAGDPPDRTDYRIAC